MTPAVYNEQQALADTFTRIGLLPVKVDVRSATGRWINLSFPGGGRHSPRRRRAYPTVFSPLPICQIKVGASPFTSQFPILRAL